MSNSQQMKKGLSVRDLITTGILAALYMVCAMIGEAIFGFFPVLTFLCPLSILEQGKVIDCGTHDELINRCSPYQDMWAAFEQSDQWKMGGVNA